MNKISLIVKREFLSRVQKRTFLLVTVGLPLLIAVFYAGIIYFATKSNNKISIAVIDNARFFKDSLASNDDNISFDFVKNQTASAPSSVAESGENAGVINISANADLLKDSIEIMMGKKIGILDQQKIKDAIQQRLQQLKLASIVTDTAVLHSLQQDTKISFINLNDTKSDGKNMEAKSAAATGVGLFCGFLIYMILLLYGMSVLRGVMEEKTNRIAEVMVSSVKPFQLMMGKIIGVGAVGLLQFLIWIVLGIGTKILIPLLLSKQETAAAANVHAAMDAVSGVDFGLIIPVFIVYFLGGYLLYASLFAAIGSTVSDGQQDVQGLQLPVTLPIIFGIVIMMQTVNNPSSSLSVFGSIFPLTSPIVMMARVAQGIPDAVSWFQLIVSIILLYATFIFTTWFAGRIYRTGILLYGKKATWKELIKWAFRKD